MESLKVFYSADEAAKKLSTGSTKLSTQDIYRLANYGRLPVCFDFRGELIKHSVDGKLGLAGEAPKILDFDGVVRSLMQPTTDGVCGFAVLAEIVEVRTLKFSHKDGKLTRGINMPTEFSYGGRIKPGHKVECWLEDADVPPSAFLFHVDDLEKLVHAPHADPTGQVPETLPSAPHAGIAKPAQTPSVNRGTPKALTDEQEAEVVRLYDGSKGMSVNALAKRFGVSNPTINKVLKKANVKNQGVTGGCKNRPENRMK